MKHLRKVHQRGFSEIENLKGNHRELNEEDLNYWILPLDGPQGTEQPSGSSTGKSEDMDEETFNMESDVEVTVGEPERTPEVPKRKLVIQIENDTKKRRVETSPSRDNTKFPLRAIKTALTDIDKPSNSNTNSILVELTNALNSNTTALNDAIRGQAEIESIIKAQTKCIDQMTKALDRRTSECRKWRKAKLAMKEEDDIENGNLALKYWSKSSFIK